ncbi:MAG: V-type ATP synthase subunit F [Desulfuromonadales bacterium]
MKRVVVLTPQDARYGFALAGVEQRLAAPTEAEELLREALSEPDAGVVMIDERLLSEIEPERLRELESRWFGVLLILPAPQQAEAENYLQRLLARVLGYQVRISP